MTAKNKEHYIKVWNSHISELAILSYSLDVKGDLAHCVELYEIRARLKELVLIAADLEFEDDFPEPPAEKNYVL